MVTNTYSIALQIKKHSLSYVFFLGLILNALVSNIYANTEPNISTDLNIEDTNQNALKV